VGDDPKSSESLTRIVSARHTQRLKGLLEDKPGTILVGGDVDEEHRYVAPTLITDVNPEARLMKEEIFGELPEGGRDVDLDQREGSHCSGKGGLLDIRTKSDCGECWGPFGCGIVVTFVVSRPAAADHQVYSPIKTHSVCCFGRAAAADQQMYTTIEHRGAYVSMV
jgi:hypothetical protein